MMLTAQSHQQIISAEMLSTGRKWQQPRTPHHRVQCPNDNMPTITVFVLRDERMLHQDSETCNVKRQHVLTPATVTRTAACPPRVHIYLYSTSFTGCLSVTRNLRTCGQMAFDSRPWKSYKMFFCLEKCSIKTSLGFHSIIQCRSRSGKKNTQKLSVC